MAENFYAAAATTCRFLRGLGVGGISIIAFLGLAGRVDATYLHSEVAYGEIAPIDFNAGDYLDRVWYYLLDDGQYHYLDKGQYNLMGGLSYQLGHPAYPKLFERASDQAVGFTNRANAAWLGSVSGRVTIIEYPALYSNFNTGDYIDKARYYFLDKGQYYYLDAGQYNLLGGLGYLFGRPYEGGSLKRSAPLSLSNGLGMVVSEPSPKPSALRMPPGGGRPTPEPSTIGFLALGAFIILTSMRRSHSLVERRLTSP